MTSDSPDPQPVSPARPLASVFPARFSLGRIESVCWLSPEFLRVRVLSGNIDRLAGTEIHFRMVLPCPDVPTIWPMLDRAARVVWPQTLHRPVYTVTAIDAAAGWLEADIFVHPGGRVCNFMLQTQPDVEIGLMGPGGGGVPVADRLLIGGDETAYPALSRIIAAQNSAKIDCYLFGERTAYPFPRHPGLTMYHRPQGEEGTARQLALGFDADFAWFASEKSRMRHVKQAIRPILPKLQTHLAVYWTRPHENAADVAAKQRAPLSEP